MDPSNGCCWKVVWEALEDAGITRTRLSNHTAGVFIGMSSAEYGDLLLNTNDLSNMDVYTLSGTARSILAWCVLRCLRPERTEYRGGHRLLFLPCRSPPGLPEHLELVIATWLSLAASI